MQSPTPQTQEWTQEWTETLRDGSRVTIRPIRKQDRELERQFIEGLSPRSRRFRFLGAIKSPSEALLSQLTDIDTVRDAAFIALTCDDAERCEIGVARFSAQPDGTAEIAVTVSDGWQHKGLGTTLMKHLIDLARARGIDSLYSVDAADNDAMRELAEYLGFERKADPQDTTQVIHRLDLRVGYVTNIERDTLANEDYRRVLFTGRNTQLVLMTLKPGEEIGSETHEEHDQFIRVESGTGKVLLNRQEHPLSDGVAVVIPAGVEHNVINTSSSAPLRLYTLYSPPEHPDGTVHRTKADEPAEN